MGNRMRLTIMENQAQRPWIGLYRGVRPELKPACETGLDMFRTTLERNGSAPLVHYFDGSLSFSDCDAMSDALAVGLQARGVEAGDRVAVYLQNVPQVVIAVLAIWKCGAVVVPCNPMLRERELGKILRSSGCLAMICHEDLYADVGRAALPSTAVRHTITTSPLEFLEPGKPLPRMLAGIRRNPQPDASDMLEIVAKHKGERPRPVELTCDDVAFMVHTSGTTGDAKGAMNTHRNVVFATSVYEAWIGLTANDVILGSCAALPCHGAHRARDAGDAGRLPIGAVLSVRRQRGVSARGLPSCDVHGFRDHRVYRAAE